MYPIQIHLITKQTNQIRRFLEVCNKYKAKMSTLSLKKLPILPIYNVNNPILINTSSDDECESTSQKKPPQTINARKRKHTTFQNKAGMSCPGDFRLIKMPSTEKNKTQKNKSLFQGWIYLERKRQ